MRPLVIIPTYNEVESVGSQIERVLQIPELEVLVVDDNSPDGTADLVHSLMRSEPRLHLLKRERKDGLGRAYLAGFAWGKQHNFDYLIEMDADGSHRVEDLPKLLAEAPNCDLVIGSRWVNGGQVQNWSKLRELISRSGNLYARKMLGCDIRDMTAGFRCFKTEFLNRLDLGGVAARGYAFQVEVAWRSANSSAKITEVPIIFIERENGVSKMTYGIVLEALFLVTRWGIGRIFSGRKSALGARFSRLKN